MKNADANIQFQEQQYFVFKKTIYRHFSPQGGEPILPHRLRCNPFAVFQYSFMSHFLVAAAILARE
jgi:hypothetical protein